MPEDAILYHAASRYSIIEDRRELVLEATVNAVEAMREARRQGFTMQQIADAAGITRQRVHQLLNKEA